MTKVLDCEFVITDNWTILSGSATGFGDGTDYIQVSRTSPYAVGLSVSVTGDASLIDRVEFDSTVEPDVENYGYYDSNNEWVNLSNTNTLSYDVSGSTFHIIYSFDSYSTTIDRLWVTLKSSLATLSNFRIYDASGNILNMETSPSDDDDDTYTATFSPSLGPYRRCCMSILLDVAEYPLIYFPSSDDE